MRAIIQRVSEATITIDGRAGGAIGRGFVVLVGVARDDTAADVEWLAGKIARLRVFDDGDGQMNRALADVGGELLVVSQFTLHASTRKGNRPSFLEAARPDTAIPLYEAFVDRLRALGGVRVATGEFGADMRVALVNDGPVTIAMDSRRRD